MCGFELKKIDLSFSNYKNSRTFAPVIANLAQLVEQRIRNAEVWGSSHQIGSAENQEVSYKKRPFRRD